MMGYLDPYLRNNPQQIVHCDKLYNLWLYVKHPTGAIQITMGDSRDYVAMRIKDVVPDVEDWQYGGEINNQYIFKFHTYSDREQARINLEQLNYSTSSQDFIKI